MPSSRHGTLSMFSRIPAPPLLAISTLEEVRPAAPMSWIAITQSASMISRQASSSSFSAKGSPTCTVGRFSSEFSSPALSSPDDDRATGLRDVAIAHVNADEFAWKVGDGACELDSDCGGADRCLSGWCGVPCEAGACGGFYRYNVPIGSRRVVPFIGARAVGYLGEYSEWDAELRAEAGIRHFDIGDSDHYSRIRLEALQSEREREHGHATVRALAPGYRFNLTNCPRDEANREYLLVSVTYRLQEPCYASDPTPACYECDFVTQPTSLPFRPRRVTPKPRTNGPDATGVTEPALAA